jgi:hypothetical protein
MPAIELLELVIPASLNKNGMTTIAIDPPGNLKIQTTGESGEMVFNQGPAHGKHWAVTLRVEIVEM